jgi:hypothetical protein
MHPPVLYYCNSLFIAHAQPPSTLSLPPRRPVIKRNTVLQEVASFCHRMRLRGRVCRYHPPLNPNLQPVMLCRAGDVESFTHNLTERAALAQQRSQQLSRDIERMRQQLTSTHAQLQQLLPLKPAAAVRPCLFPL